MDRSNGLLIFVSGLFQLLDISPSTRNSVSRSETYDKFADWDVRRASTSARRRTPTLDAELRSGA
jgi:hypothetical protein